MSNNDPKVKLFSNASSGNTFNNYDGGLDSKLGIGLKCTQDSETRHLFDTKTGNYQLTGTLSAGNVKVISATGSTIPIFDSNNNIISSNIPSSKINYLDATSSIQT